MVYIVLVGWIIANALQILRPLELWAMPALGIWLLVALLPAAMPSQIVDSKMPDRFIAEHLDSLKQTTSLLSNDLGAASALSWLVKRPQVDLYNVIGELKYGLSDPAMASRKVTMDNVGQWMTEARKKGSVGVVMRVKSVDEIQEVEALRRRPAFSTRRTGNPDLPAKSALTAIDIKNRELQMGFSVFLHMGCMAFGSTAAPRKASSKKPVPEPSPAFA